MYQIFNKRWECLFSSEDYAVVKSKKKELKSINPSELLTIVVQSGNYWWTVDDYS